VIMVKTVVEALVRPEVVMRLETPVRLEMLGARREMRLRVRERRKDARRGERDAGPGDELRGVSQ
jgi:hypothetical protein